MLICYATIENIVLISRYGISILSKLISKKNVMCTTISPNYLCSGNSQNISPLPISIAIHKAVAGFIGWTLQWSTWLHRLVSLSFCWFSRVIILCNNLWLTKYLLFHTFVRCPNKLFSEGKLQAHIFPPQKEPWSWSFSFLMPLPPFSQMCILRDSFSILLI